MRVNVPVRGLRMVRATVLALLPVAALLSTGYASAAPAGMPFLSPLFSDNMVLQRGVHAPVWGWTDPGAPVTVSMNGKSDRVTAGADGKWMAALGPFSAGGPYTLTVSGPENTVLHNVMVGDVWICSGQSNMEFGIGNGNNAKEEIAAADYPNIRLFTVAKTVAASPRAVLPPPRADLANQWSICTPQTIATGGWNGFTAVGYFFGRYLYQKLGVSIGLIHTSWGGTPAEAWTSAGALKTMADYQPAIAQIDQAVAAQAAGTPLPQQFTNNPNVPTVLYNGMIAPLLPYAIKGAIWYQGESNAGKAYQYRTLLPTMIQDWRAHWGEGAFPFLIVQLANFMQTKPDPGEDAWAELREAQLMTAQSTPHTGMAVIIDIGDANDIHPKDKQDVGKRLALIALATVYHQKVEYSGPLYRSMSIDGSKIRLNFSHVDGGLVARGGPLQGFAIAGADRHFVWADAVIDGSHIVVSSPQVTNPVAVRYAWASNPVCNLYNQEGLPASPFRTDSWPGITVNNH